MKTLPVVYHPDYSVPLPDGHRFPMAKFTRLHQHLLNTFGSDGIQTWTPKRPPLAWVEMVHDPNFVHDYYFGTLDYQAQRRIGLPWSEALVRRTLTAVGGTILTARLALKFGLGLNTAGGNTSCFSKLWFRILHFQRFGDRYSPSPTGKTHQKCLDH